MSRYPSVPPKPSAASSAAKTAPSRRLISSKKAGECLGISPNSIRKLVADGKLAAYLIGEKKLVKFDPKDVEHYLAANRIDNS